jgi:alpha-L-fucosidase
MEKSDKDREITVDASKSQHELIGIDQVSRTYQRTRHPDAQWFGEAGLGLFLHWGLSSVNGNMDLSWGMMANTPYDGEYYNFNKLPPTEYWKLAEDFDPVDYDPELWLKAARDAGVRYAILTTRHHEGFALWPSEFGDFNTGNCLAGRDLLSPYVSACRKLGIRVGFYYSPPDWRVSRDYMSFNYRSGVWPDEWIARHPEAYSLVPKGAWNENWELRDEPPVMPEEFEREYAMYVRGQIRELLTNYGAIDVMWFDGNPFSRYQPISVEEIRQLQPGIVINPRLHGTVDFETPECRLPEHRPDGWWEGCFIWNQGGWGYSRSELYQSSGWFLDLLAKHRTWNGNLLINCAPRPDGRMPETYYRRMDDVATWMRDHRETLFGVTGGPYPEQCDVPVTLATDGSWYIHLTTRKQCTITGRGRPRSAHLHGSEKPVNVRVVGDKTIVVLQFEDITELDDVVHIRWD